MLRAHPQTSVIARVLLILTTAICAGRCASAPPPAATPSRRAPLVVLLVVDQLRTGYLENYQPHFTGGLRRLIDGGTWFKRAAYPYLNTVTCAGHATIGTGALPYRHGMVLNGWWDRETARTRLCTADSNANNIAYAGTVTGGDSSASILVPTLADQLRTRTGGRTVVFSLKPRSAITLAGSHPTSVVWFDDRAGWTTSSAFTDAPLDWLQQYFAANPVTADRDKVWERSLPASSYRGDDAGAGERTATGWTTSFPHRLGEPAEQFNSQWQRSPFADEYLGRVAAHAVDTLKLGRGDGVDMLAVSFSTLDLVGHMFGPESHEVQDVMVRLDRTIGTLLDHLDKTLGRDGYVVGLSADHGVAALPEQSGGQRLPSSSIVTAVNSALEPFFGPGKYVAHSAYTDLYLAPDILPRVKASPEASKAVLDALRALPGITHAYWSDEVRSERARASTDPALRAAALSHYPARSGDIIIVPRENWLLSTAATTHGTLHWYDQNVPVLFYGAGVPRGTSDATATPADVAPTLAALAGVTFDRTDGTALLNRRTVARPQPAGARR